LLASFRAELLVLRKWPAAWVLVLLWPFAMLVSNYAIQYVLYRTAATGTFSDLGPILPSILPGQFVIVAMRDVVFFGATPAVVLGALVAGGDWGRGTVKTSLTQGPGRVPTFAGQALAVAAALALSVALTFAVAAACSLLVSAAAAGKASPADAAFPAAVVVARGVGVALLVVATYGAAGLALGTLFRGAGPAIGAALVWTVVVQYVLDTLALQVGGAFEAFNDALPNANALSLAGTFGSAGGGAGSQVLLRTDPAVAAWVLAGYTLAFVAAAAILVGRRDVA